MEGFGSLEVLGELVLQDAVMLRGQADRQMYLEYCKFIVENPLRK